MSCETYDIVNDCADERILSTIPGNESLLEKGKVTEAKFACSQKLRQERSCKKKEGGKRRRRRKSRRKSKRRKSRRKKRRKSKKRKTRRRRRRRK